MVEFDVVITEFLKLKPIYQEAIADICKQMGSGMAEFAEKDGATGTETKEEYNLYCHYVAGLVGVGPATLFVNVSSVAHFCFAVVVNSARLYRQPQSGGCAIVHPFRWRGLQYCQVRK
jgi:phytoene/squalene synthetase